MKVYFETLGCPKNFNDTQVAKEYLVESGIEIADNPDECDAIVVNTCGFINDAKKESIDKIFEMASYKENGTKLIVSGCLSERYSDELFEEVPEVDCFIGVNEYDKLADIIQNLNERKIQVSGHHPNILKKENRLVDDNIFTQTIKIAEGCDNRCAYCVIPSIRGSYRSKPFEDVISEAEELAAKGCKELIVIAQDVTNYGQDLYGERILPKLLETLCRVEGIQWIRLMYCYEDRISDELIDVMAKEEKICKYIDIPIQHASDRVLRQMRRRSTNETIRGTISRLKKAIPDIHIRTTLIVGFPGESDDDFDILDEFVRDMEFARLGVFAYSREENTPAGEMDNQIEESVKQQRLDKIMRTQMDISLRSNQEKIGKTLQVLVEEEDEDGSYIGRSQYDAPEIDNAVLFTSERSLKPGDIVEVLIEDGYDYDLVGREA